MTETRKLRVFLCHASQDKPVVRELYRQLLAEGWIDPWLDEEKLLPGQDWNMEIEKAVEAADVVIACLSNNSVSKEGYIQREIRFALDIALEKPEGTIFIIPLRLDDCEVPRRLRSWHYVDYFLPNDREDSYQRLLQSLIVRYRQSQSRDDGSKKVRSDTAGDTDKVIEEKKTSKKTSRKEFFHRMADSSLSKGTGGIDVGSSIPLMLYFSLAGLNALRFGDTVKFLLGILAIIAGIALLNRKQIPTTVLFKVSAIVYFLIYGQGYRLGDNLVAHYVASTAAFISGGVLVFTARAPKKRVYYFSLSFAIFLFLVGIFEITTSFSYYPSAIDTLGNLILIVSIVTSILMMSDL
jgi:hypothetical protein